ncbi:uncharacterized protein LOC126326046 [Schistocerca gregaria]|uniref:uncharacterized protein LOC126326046 n=1 Tax=Schistocerca gregaria TaxID=7010 RepID=UPI00211DCE06|nr:uncharacterized protein LOC126326046 [Schistocerca gregaria]
MSADVPLTLPTERCAFLSVKDLKGIRQPSPSTFVDVVASTSDRNHGVDRPPPPLPMSTNYSRLLNLLTVFITHTYARIDPLRYSCSDGQCLHYILTTPSERSAPNNRGLDNQENDLIMSKNDLLGPSTEPCRYMVMELLGKGTFGQVVKCWDKSLKIYVAIKVVKNLPAFHRQGFAEIRVIKQLNTKYASPNYPLVQILNYFVFSGHLCLVFELLNVSLYELIRRNLFRGLSLPLVSKFVHQILRVLVDLGKNRIIHCDLKPENILLKSPDQSNIKVIDFGSACFQDEHAVYSYVQSRFYRCPEVILGYSATYSKLDLWSLGCICFELFTGFPLFPGTNQHQMVVQFVRVLGMPPYSMLANGRDSHRFFNRVAHTGAKTDFVLKTSQECASSDETSSASAVPELAKIPKETSIELLVSEIPYSDDLSAAERIQEELHRQLLISFLQNILKWNPNERSDAEQLLLHPFFSSPGLARGAYPPFNNSSNYVCDLNGAYPPGYPRNRDIAKEIPNHPRMAPDQTLETRHMPAIPPHLFLPLGNPGQRNLSNFFVNRLAPRQDDNHLFHPPLLAKNPEFTPQTLASQALSIPSSLKSATSSLPHALPFYHSKPPLPTEHPPEPYYTHSSHNHVHPSLAQPAVGQLVDPRLERQPPGTLFIPRERPEQNLFFHFPVSHNGQNVLCQKQPKLLSEMPDPSPLLFRANDIPPSVQAPRFSSPSLQQPSSSLHTDFVHPQLQLRSAFSLLRPTQKYFSTSNVRPPLHQPRRAYLQIPSFVPSNQ